LLKVGRSRWSSDPAVAKLGLGSVTAGAFGIGFMSTLMVSDRIVVETQSNLPMENGIRLTLFGWQGYAATEPLGATAPGTTVHVRVNDSFFSSSQDLAAQLAALVPIPDFPLRVVADGTETPVPELDLDPAASEQRPQCVAPIDALGSFVRIAADSGRSSNATVWRGPKTIVALLRKRNPSIRLCQDGIAIPEMALPASRDPEVAILEERGCLVDLRGSSRVPLDLSRNLVEGGNERFWTGEIPNLWNAICASASTDPVALRALGEVATRTLHVSGVQDPLRFAAPGGAFVRGLRSLDAEEIVCVDPYWDLSSEALTKEGATAWLTPDTEIKEVAAELPFELPMLDPTGEFSDYALLGGDGEDDDGSVFRASATLDREWERLTQTFKWVSPASHVPCRLSRKERSGSRKVSQLFAFQASRNWMSVLSPLYGVHELFPKSSVESAAAAARERELSLGDFYVFLLDALFQVGHDDWGRHGPLADALSKVASRLDRRRAERPPPATRAGEESDDEEVRRQVEERLDQDADLYQGIALECDVDALAASWEAEAWEAGTFGSDRRR